MLALLLLFLLALGYTQHSYVYTVQIKVNDTIYTYIYNFTIISQNSSTIKFILNITNYNTQKFVLNNYSVNLSNPNPLPINYHVFNTSNLTYVRNVTLNGIQLEEYEGIFKVLGKYEVPVDVYFYNGTLYMLNGTANGVSIMIIGQNIVPSTTASSTSTSISSASSGYIILLVFLIMIIIAIIIFLKIGKI